MVSYSTKKVLDVHPPGHISLLDARNFRTSLGRRGWKVAASKEVNTLANPYLISPAASVFFSHRQLCWGLLRLKLRRAQERESYKRRGPGRKRASSWTVTIERITTFMIRVTSVGALMGHNGVKVRKRTGDARLFLQCFRRDFHYVEHATGHAELALFGERLPESICAGLGGGHLRLSEIVVSRLFYGAGDPIVTRVRNGSRAKRAALILKLRVSFNPYVGLPARPLEHGSRHSPDGVPSADPLLQGAGDEDQAASL